MLPLAQLAMSPAISIICLDMLQNFRKKSLLIIVIDDSRYVQASAEGRGGQQIDDKP